MWFGKKKKVEKVKILENYQCFKTHLMININHAHDMEL